MTVTGNYQTPAAWEAAAQRYRALGFRVTIVTQQSERAGSFTYLHCEYAA